MIAASIYCGLGRYRGYQTLTVPMSGPSAWMLISLIALLRKEAGS